MTMCMSRFPGSVTWGEVRHARNDRRAAPERLEHERGLEQAPRRRVQPKLAVSAEREEFKGKARTLGSHRAVKELEQRELEEQRGRKIQKMREASFPNPPTTRGPSHGIQPAPRNIIQERKPDRDNGNEL